MTTELATRGMAEVLENVLLGGNLADLEPEERLAYYNRVCESLGLNPLTKPFEYIELNRKLTLYAKKDATDQLREKRGVSVTQLERQRLDDLYVVTAYATDKHGRTDSSIGAVNVKGLAGELLANALMKAETKAKRRVTLSICGLGWSDESEVDSIPSARTVVVDHDTGRMQGELPAAKSVNKQTGEAEIEESEYDAAVREWVSVEKRATELNITHTANLPHNADITRIKRWTEALSDLVSKTARPSSAA